MAKDKKHSAPEAEEQDRIMDDEPQIMDDMLEADDEEKSEEMKQTLQDEADIVSNMQNELNDTRAALDKEKKEYLFLMAEFDNFRKRNVKERADLIKNAAEKTMLDLLPVVDDMERGLEAAKSVEDTTGMMEGMTLIYNKLMKVLEKYGVKPIESTGKPFDADTMEAIAMVPVEDEAQKGVVIDTPSKGYMINDKVLRHAKVAVGQ